MSKYKKTYIKIAWQLLFWFLIIGLSVAVLLTTVSFWKAQEALTHEITNNLYSIAERQSEQIANYLTERERHIHTLATIPEVQQACQVFLAHGDSSKQTESAKALLRYKEAFRYENLFFVSVDGKLCYSSQPQLKNINFKTHNTYQNTELAAVFERANILLQSEISDFSYAPFTPYPTAFIAQPMYIKGLIKGVLIAQINNQEINAIINNYTGLGKTGETMLLALVKNKAILIADLRNRAHSAFELSFDINEEKNNSLAPQYAIKGQRGSGLDTDYRGQQVIALWSYIPSLRAGLVIKIDTDEAFEPIQKLRFMLITIILLTVLVVIFVAFYIARRIAKPIVALTKFSENVGQGDLDTRIHIKAQNEIGQLADAFNQMVENLKISKSALEDYSKNLEQKVKQRTLTIKEQNEELQASEEELRQNLEELQATQETLQQQKEVLEKTLQELKSSQAQLIHSEKMATLGQRVANIAH
ncbi:MAG: HAMP domain-containing protein [Bernardetiaceae bacterium]|nr:HAMP domain-containing protein [Bernardetiaceae bacterium]